MIVKERYLTFFSELVDDFLNKHDSYIIFRIKISYLIVKICHIEEKTLPVSVNLKYNCPMIFNNVHLDPF